TLADWVGGTSHLLEPLVEALRRHVMAAGKLHADDTPVPVLAPGQGKTKTGRLWTYVRDDRPANDPSPPAVWFAYSPDHKGKPPELRRAARQQRSLPLLASLRAWLEKTLSSLSRKSDTAIAIRYGLSRWTALLRYCDNGQIEMDNNAAERALRAVALGRKNYLFAGSDAGGERAAAIYSLIGTAKLNALDPEAYF